MEKNRMIIVEGPQGTGKTTLTNYLRDNISGANLYRLSGSKDKTLTGKDISRKMYESLLEYLKNMQSIPIDLIFDRTFFSEEVYARLGYKEYSFTDVYDELVAVLNNLDYEIYLFLLYLENTEIYKSRLKRESHHNYQSFSILNSIKQQEIYLDMGRDLKNTNIQVIPLAMDDFDVSYQKLNRVLRINK